MITLTGYYLVTVDVIASEFREHYETMMAVSRYVSL